MAAIELAETQNGKIAFDSEYAKADETVQFSVEPESVKLKQVKMQKDR